ncbi:hypothetical protein BDW66DRAFT_142533 [Aspergillus desertorum]
MQGKQPGDQPRRQQSTCISNLRRIYALRSRMGTSDLVMVILQGLTLASLLSLSDCRDPINYPTPVGIAPVFHITCR